MIDEEWLAQLEFETFNGIKVVGCLGVGSAKVVLRGFTPSGQEVAVQTYRHMLGYHIRELPPQIAPGARYDYSVLNRKLGGLLGVPDLDEMMSDWDRLFSVLTKTIIDNGVESLLMLPIADKRAVLLADALPALLCSSPLRRRLRELAHLELDPEWPFVTINGPNFPITGITSTLASKASAALAVLDRFDAQRNLEQSPIFVWGGAAMEGFFDRGGQEAAADFVEQAFGWLPKRADVLELMEEADMLASVFVFFFPKEEDRVSIRKFLSMCSSLGFMLDVRDGDGRPITSRG